MWLGKYTALVYMTLDTLVAMRDLRDDEDEELIVVRAMAVKGGDEDQEKEGSNRRTITWLTGIIRVVRVSRRQPALMMAGDEGQAEGQGQHMLDGGDRDVEQQDEERGGEICMINRLLCIDRRQNRIGSTGKGL